ncbi:MULTISPECIES: disulfide oxidoreductase [Geomicrobium]|uniref:Disulfide bond formation protein DsbB n=1 Tax=Geomicrobium sediminis TaxID=1347788 RepID=A0ABS2P9G1_9BACL|nr:MULTISPECIES: disulfide oxidoreductase [Geomicrobium]MBM7631949.1 disulfide bond formation protein DsbB [Geomicrobium sediminis]GAK00447.1 disulfide bond formation protein, BdbC-like [Geomicrobium sp. JCM 19055]
MTRSSIFLYVAWVISLIATGGSLFYSIGLGFVPCDMCWYQRIAMYPLAIILGIATFRSDFNIRWYALPFSIIGAVMAAYHYALQKIPGFGSVTPCQSGVPCNAEYMNVLGFITIPFQALVAFLLITVLLFLAKPKHN